MNSLLYQDCESLKLRGAFHLSKRVDLALIFLMALMKSGDEPLSLRDVSHTQHLSFYFLQNVARGLKQAGLIEAVRGKSGGYVLAAAAEQITLKKVVEAVDGPIAVMQCVNSQLEPCTHQSYCLLHPGMKKLNSELERTFLSKKLTYFA